MVRFLGHGAYLGPDYTADYLHRSAQMAIDFYNGLGSDHAKAVTIAYYHGGLRIRIAWRGPRTSGAHYDLSWLSIRYGRPAAASIELNGALFTEVVERTD
jgi:hypothetical protein